MIGLSSGFFDFKYVEAYNTALHRIVGQLRFCGQRVTEYEMIEKTLETFHPSNTVLQQQYRNNKYKKYYKLINVLLAAETQNELLMKNYHMCPGGAQVGPEAHASFRKNFRRDKGQGQKAPWKHKGGRTSRNMHPKARSILGKGRPRMAPSMMRNKPNIQTKVAGVVVP